ncbi:MAG: MBL fold metallo-hydrolase [Desulfovibrio sp.]|nr:MBL fold metallo-hydrolase [Desulfovibrio sp.]
MSRRKFLLSLAGLGALAVTGVSLWPIYRAFGDSSREDFISPHWRSGSFHNLPNAYVYPDLASEPAYTGGWLKFFLSRDDNRYPTEPVKSVKTDLASLRDGEFVWLGHSSLLLKLAGKYFCFDPVFARRASPVPFTIPAWPGSTPRAPEDFPVIDYLCLSHDHWDHLDYEAATKLKYKTVVCGLGVGSHLRYWGVGNDIVELDWFKSTGSPIKIVFTPSMHFSGRGLKRNRTLWGGFVIDAGDSGKIYFTGDGGYGAHFAEIGKNYGPFDIIFPDSGQYNRCWPTVHMFPEQAVRAAVDSRAALACPVHRGKFTLSWHSWDEPEKRFAREATLRKVSFVVPVIGEKVAIR